MPTTLFDHLEMGGAIVGLVVLILAGRRRRGGMIETLRLRHRPNPRSRASFGDGTMPPADAQARGPGPACVLPTRRTIVESPGDSLLVIDEADRVVDLNRAAEAQFDLPRRRLLGALVADLLPTWGHLRRSLEARSELHAKIEVELGERPRGLEVQVLALREAGSAARFLVLLRDLSRRGEYQRRIEHLAYHDSLTGLPNRRWLERTGSQWLEKARRETREAAILFVDLDDFKDINDTLGHAAGDELLLEVARRFRATVRSESVLARLGGDEFAVLVRDCDGVCAQSVGTRLLEAVAEPFRLPRAEVWVGASIGCALFPRHGGSMAELLRRADVAMYAAKRVRGRVEVYDPTRDPFTYDRLRLQSELHRALDGPDQLVVHYQPIFDIATGRAVAVEGLVRWRHPGRGLLAPETILPAAERARLTSRLDLYVLRRALRDWGPTAVEVAVNVHPRTLSDRSWVEAVGRELAASGVPARRLALEVSERALGGQERTATALADLAALGVTLMADDYGTGQSSLIHIRRLPFHGLKIDRTLAAGIGARREDEAVVEAVADLARRLDLRLVVAGVESSAVTEWLRARGCRFVQGLALAPPLPREQLLERCPELGAGARPGPAEAG